MGTPNTIPHIRLQSHEGKKKMHELYQMWLSCKGVWSKCSLVVKAHKSRSQDAEEAYDFLPKSGLLRELGEEVLVKELMERHEQAERKLPAHQKGLYIKTYLDY